MDDLAVKRELIEICHRLVELDYVIGTYGNVSAACPVV